MDFMIRVALIVVLCVGLAACAERPAKWEKPGATSDQWSVDLANCRSKAKRLAEKEFAVRAPAGSDGGVDTGAGYEALMGRFEAGRNERRLLHRCLERLGYRPVAKDAQQ